MGKRLLTVLAPMVGLALVAMPGVVLRPLVTPTQTECAGGLCDVCPAVAKAMTAAGAEIYCIA